MEESKVRQPSKPLSMKLFSLWDGERTAPHCIPRTCTFKLQSLKLTKPLDLDSSNLTICASMSVGNFRRSLRTDEIYPNNNGIAELDYCFSFQYPHYLKREDNMLKLSLQRRKRYRNRTILGYKTVAIGTVDLSQVMQCTFDDTLKLFAKGGGFQIAQLRLYQITSIPHESIRNHSGENSSTDDDVHDMFFPSDDDLDSEGEERMRGGKKKSKFKDDLKLKKKFNALLRKMKINDDVEPLHEDPAALPPEEYSQAYSSILAGISDESVQYSDSDSIGTLPKPHLRPYFTADFENDDPSPTEKGSSTDEGREGRMKQPLQFSPTTILKSTRSVSLCSTSGPVIGDIRAGGGEHGRVDRSDESCEVSRSSPTRQSPNSQNSSDSGDVTSRDLVKYRSSSQDTEDYSITEQLGIMFKQETIPSNIVLCFFRDKMQHPIIRSLSTATSNTCLFLQNAADAKLLVSTLVSKMQKFVNRHSSVQTVTLTVIGDFASGHLVLKPLTDSLTNKGSEWIHNFKFIFISTDDGNPICSYISTIDASYLHLVDIINSSELFDVALLSAYQSEVNKVAKLSIGRVLLSQAVDDEQRDSKQFELPFLSSVSIALKKENCVFCEAVDNAEDAEKCRDHELDFLVDYSTQNKKDANSKQFQVKGIFRELCVYRDLAAQHDSLCVNAAYREKKPKALTRLNKKQCDILNIQCNVNNFTCMIKSNTSTSFTVHVDGVQLKNVTSFYISPVWSQHLSYLPVSIRDMGGLLC